MIASLLFLLIIYTIISFVLFLFAICGGASEFDYYYDGSFKRWEIFFPFIYVGCWIRENWFPPIEKWLDATIIERKNK